MYILYFHCCSEAQGNVSNGEIPCYWLLLDATRITRVPGIEIFNKRRVLHLQSFRPTGKTD